MKSMCEPHAEHGPAVLRHRRRHPATTGGDLAEILDKIGYVVRERFRILGQVKASPARAGSRASC